MYASSLPNESSVSSEALRRNLGAVYARVASPLRERARIHLRSRDRAYDAVQDAFLAVLENPPADTSEPSLRRALESALYRVTGKHAQSRRIEADIATAIRQQLRIERASPTAE